MRGDLLWVTSSSKDELVLEQLGKPLGRFRVLVPTECTHALPGPGRPIIVANDTPGGSMSVELECGHRVGLIPIGG